MTYPKQVWEYDKEELAEMYAIAQCEIERLRMALHDLRKAYIFWVGDKGDGEALARANALLDVYERTTPKTEEDEIEESLRASLGDGNC